MAQELYTLDWYEYGILFLKKKQFIPLGMVPLSVLSVAKPKGLKRSVVSGKIFNIPTSYGNIRVINVADPYKFTRIWIKDPTEPDPDRTFCRIQASTIQIRIFVTASVAEPEPPGAATLRVEPEPFFYLAGAESRLV